MIRILFALLLCMSAAQAASAERHELPSPVLDVLRGHDQPEDTYSAWVQEIGEADPVLAVNADQPRNPASTIKLLTTFLALEDLGPAYTWPTVAYLGGPLEDEVLDGDLYLKGYGDPYMVTERFWLFLRGLRQRGLRKIRGDLIIDNSYFAPEPVDPGAFDGQAYRIYNVQPDAFLVNFKAVSFLFRPDPQTNRLRIVADPWPANLEIQNQVDLTDQGCGGFQRGIQFAVAEAARRPTVSFSGRFSRSCDEYRLSRSVLSAPEYAYGVFRRLWEDSGGSLGGGLRVEPVPEELEPFEEFESKPLSELIRSVNKWSNNVMTRQIFLTMGAERFGPPATVEKARRAAQMSLREHGLDFPELVLDNGAGLSRRTRISARSLARVLLAAHAGPYQAEYESSLALAGIDGTLRRRFRNEELTGQMHLKTGRLNGVFAMAGYVRGRAGREYVVVAIQNARDAHRGPGEEAHVALLRWVYAR